MLKNNSSIGALFLLFQALRNTNNSFVKTQVKIYVQFLATGDDDVDDVDDECLLLYSQVAFSADLKSALSSLNFVALGLASFTVNIEPKVLNLIPARNVVLFLRTMLNTLSSDALECGSTSTIMTTLNKISIYASQYSLSFD